MSETFGDENDVARPLKVGDSIRINGLFGSSWTADVLSFNEHDEHFPLHIVKTSNNLTETVPGSPIGTVYDWGIDDGVTYADGASIDLEPIRAMMRIAKAARVETVVSTGGSVPIDHRISVQGNDVPEPPTLQVGDMVRHDTWQTELDFTVLEIDASIRKIKVKSVMGGGVFSAPWHWKVRRGGAFVEFVLPDPEEGAERCGEPVGNTGWLCPLTPGHDGPHVPEEVKVEDVIPIQAVCVGCAKLGPTELLAFCAPCRGHLFDFQRMVEREAEMHEVHRRLHDAEFQLTRYRAEATLPTTATRFVVRIDPPGCSHSAQDWYVKNDRELGCSECDEAPRKTYEAYLAQQDPDGPHECITCRQALGVVWVEAASGQRACSFECLARVL